MSHTVALFEVRYKVTTLGLCCGSDVEYFNSVEDLMLDDYIQNGDVVMQVKEDCGHWNNKIRYELHNIELYELAEYLEEWGVDTLDSDNFIVYTNGDYKPVMLKILEYKGKAD